MEAERQADSEAKVMAESSGFQVPQAGNHGSMEQENALLSCTSESTTKDSKLTMDVHGDRDPAIPAPPGIESKLVGSSESLTMKTAPSDRPDSTASLLTSTDSAAIERVRNPFRAAGRVLWE